MVVRRLSDVFCGSPPKPDPGPDPVGQSCPDEGAPCSLDTLCCVEEGSTPLTCAFDDEKDTGENNGVCRTTSSVYDWCLDQCWGWSFVFLFAGASVLYAGGGWVAGRVRGRKGTAALPHAGFWAGARGLVVDGLRFASFRPRAEYAAIVNTSREAGAPVVSSAHRELEAAAALRTELRRLELSTEGDKAALRARLSAAIAAPAEPADAAGA